VLYPGPAPQAAACRDAGVLGAVAGIMGALQALEAMKLLLGVGTNLAEHMMIFEALHGGFRIVRRVVDPACPLCNGRPAARLG
jgi:adenylyltransferase/sulfurtransferase